MFTFVTLKEVIGDLRGAGGRRQKFDRIWENRGSVGHLGWAFDQKIWGCWGRRKRIIYLSLLIFEGVYEEILYGRECQVQGFYGNVTEIGWTFNYTIYQFRIG